MPLAMIDNPNGSFTIAFAGGILKTITDTTLVKAVKDAIRNNASDDDLIKLVDPSYAIKMHPSGLFGVKDGVVYIKGEVLPEALSVRILSFIAERLPFQPLINFWNRCKQNPDPRASTDLYTFLEKNNIPITTDGCFIAYRAVRNDYMDKYTGNISNHIGAVVTMDRKEVDCNPDVTCSKGLHAAAFDYAQHSYGSNVGLDQGDRLVEVKIDPADVCAIPRDYNMQKMRVCKYVVIAENSQGPIRRQVYDTENIVEDVVDNGNQFADGGADGDEEETCEVCGEYLSECTCREESEEDEYFVADTSENWKNQKRDSKGRFIKS